MAQYYGAPSKYLKYNYRKLAFWLCLGLGAILLVAFLALNLRQAQSEVLVWLMLIPIFAFAYLAITMSEWFQKYSHSWSRGMYGEAAVRKILKTMPDTYAVVEDVNISRGNIDFVVIGPNGVFAIEVKSHRGFISFDGFNLIRNRRVIGKYFLTQTWREKKSLERLMAKSNIQIPVVPVLVFTKARMNFGFRKMRGVHVINIQNLLELIYRNKDSVQNIPAVVRAITGEEFDKEIKKLIGN